MSDDPIFYSKIPPHERKDWSDEDLSGAIWDEAHALLGGYDYTADAVTALPFGYQAVVAEGGVRAHVKGDGLVTAVWNDDGVKMFALAAECHRAMGSEEFAAFIDGIVEEVQAWQTEEECTPRSVEHDEFADLAVGQVLTAQSDEFCDRAAAAFTQMMKYLREHPETLKLDPR